MHIQAKVLSGGSCLPRGQVRAISRLRRRSGRTGYLLPIYILLFVVFHAEFSHVHIISTWVQRNLAWFSANLRSAFLPGTTFWIYLYR